MPAQLRKLNTYNKPFWQFILSPKRLIFLAIAIVIFTGYAVVNLQKNVFAATGINPTINFQGKVVNKDGTNVADGQYTFVFKIYDAASGGANPWTETQNNVQVTAGIFRVSLGSVTPISGVDFNTDNIYLGINFNSDGEMTPRVRFASVPYAFNAQKVAGLTVTDTSGTLTIPNSKVVQFGGAFTTSAQDLTLTLSGGTNVTLPTTGTLATLGGTENLSNKTFTTSVTISGVTTDLTTGTNEVLTITPNGTGNVLINPNAGGQAALVVDKTGSGDIFAASASGVTKFVIKSDGTASSSAGFTLDGVGNIQSTNSQTLTVGGGSTGDLVIGRVSQTLKLPGFDCSALGNGGKLTTTSGGILTCSADTSGAGGGDNFWQYNATTGIIANGNLTTDFLLGGTSTDSAKFAVLGIAGARGTQTASISGSLVLDSAGSLQTTKFQTLTVGGNTTGDINISPRNGSGTVTVNGTLAAKTGRTATLTVAASNSASLERSQADYVADGTADDVEIQAAINALPSGGGTVQLLEGNYSITAPITITKSNVTIIGSGKSTVLTRNFASSGDQGVIHVGDAGSNAYSGIQISQLYIDGQRSLYTGVGDDGIMFDQKITQSKISKTWIVNSGGAPIYLHAVNDGSGNTNNTVENNIILSNKYGVYVEYGFYSTYSDNFIANNDYVGIYFTQSDKNLISNNNIRLNNGSGVNDSSGNNNTITGNLSELNTAGVNIANSLNDNVSSNTIIDDQNHYGISVQGTSSNTSVTSNNIYNSDSGIIVLDTGSNNTISGNVIATCLNNGIRVDTNYNSITGNSIKSCGYGIYLTSDFNNLTGNIVSNNVVYGMYINGANSNIINSNKIDNNGDHGILVGNSSTNTISSNDITDTAGTSFAIYVDALTSANNYLIGNRYSGPGASTIRDLGNGTIIQQGDRVAVSGAATGKAQLMLNETGDQDIFTASASGVTKFNLSRAGVITASNYSNCTLKTDTSGVFSCGTDGLSNWTLSSVNGTLSPNNNTLDLLIGGISTSSAKFAVLGIAAGTNPTASVSATSGSNTGNGIVISGDGTVQSLRNNTLTLGGNTSGELILKSRNATVFKNPGSGNIMVGESAGNITTTGGLGTFVGFEAGLNSNADGNTFVGNSAGRTTGTGANNTFVGRNAGYANNGGGANAFFGFEAGRYTNAGNDTFIGQRAGYSNQSGTNNTFLGFEAGESPVGANANVSGANNVFIGYQSGPGSTTQLSNAGAIGYQAIVNASNALVLGGTGANAINVGIGTTTPLATLQVTGGNMGGNSAFILNQTGVSTNDIFAASASGVTKFVIKNDGTASTSGNLVLNSAGSVQSTKNQTLTIGGNTTGDISLLPRNGTGYVGINNSSPTSALEVNGILTLDDLTAPTANKGTITYDSSGVGTGYFVFNSGETNNFIAEFRDCCNAIFKISNTGNESIFSYNLGVEQNLRVAGNLGLGIAPQTAQLYVTRALSAGATGQALAIFDQIENQDILTASAAGITKFTIKNDGTASSSAGFVIDGVGSLQSTKNQTLTVGGGTTGNLVLGRSSQTISLPGFDCSALGNGGKLTTTSGGILTCSADTSGAGGGDNFWQYNATTGIVANGNLTTDLLLGGTSTQSAKFAVLGIAAGTNPSASVSAQSGANANKGVYISGDGSLQSVRNNTLTIGGSTTGDVWFKPGSSTGSLYLKSDGWMGLGTTNPGGTFEISKADEASIVLSANTDNADGNAWQTPIIVFDNRNSQEKGMLGITVAADSCPNNASCPDAIYHALVLADTTNDSLQFGSGNTTAPIRMTILPTGNIGIGTNAPISTFQLTRPLSWDATGKALAIFDQIENQDILTASAAGITKFTIKNDGTASSSAGFVIDGVGSLQSTKNQTLTVGGGTTGNLVLGRSSQAISLPGFDCSALGNGGKLTTTSGGILTCSADTSGAGGGDNFWQYNATTGIIANGNLTTDLLLGGTSTQSAMFSVLGIASGTNPSASVSATQGANAGKGIYLSGDGSLQSVRNNTLTIGGSTTGNIVLTPNNGVGGTVSITAGTSLTTQTALSISGASYIHTAAETGSLLSFSFTDASTNTSGSSITNGLNIASAFNTSGNGTKNVIPFNAAAPTLTGCTTGLCLWAGFVAANQTTGVASNVYQYGFDFSALGISAGNLTAFTSNNITNGAGTETGYALGTGWDYGLAIGTTTPVGYAHIAGGNNGASAGKAALVVDQLGNSANDIFTASASGVTKFTVKNDGTASMSGNLVLDSAGSLQTTKSQTLTLGGTTTGNIKLSPLNNAGGVSINKTTGPLASLDVKDLSSAASIGSEKITSSNDRDFTSDTGNWTAAVNPENWAIYGGKLNKSASGATAVTLANSALDSAPVAGNTYVISVDYTTTASSSGSLTISFGGTNSVAIAKGQSESGSQVHAIVAANTGVLTLTPTSSWYGTIDNVSVKQMTTASIALRLEASNGTSNPFEIRTGSDSLKNLFIGNGSGVIDSSGSMNVGVGYQALYRNVTGNSNTANGYSALAFNTTGGSNTAFGANALGSNTSGNNNTAVGLSALVANTSGGNNTGIGYGALTTNGSGGSNTALGYLALWSNTTGSNNTASGFDALGSNTSGSSNTATGYGASINNTLGTNNTSIGYSAGGNNTVGGSNTFLGYKADAASGNLINAAAIGANAYVNSNDSLVLGSINGVNSATGSARIGIGTITPNYVFDVTGGYGSNSLVSLNQNNSGDILTASSAGVTKFVLTNSGNASSSAGFTINGIGSIQTTNNQTLQIGGSTTGNIIFPNAGGIFLGQNELTNGLITFFSSGVGKTDPSIYADSSGNLILSAPSGTVQVGNGSGNITMSLTNVADVFTADKTVTLAANYTGTDYTFSRVLTGGANNQGGAILKITDTSGGSGTINPDMLLVNAALTSGNFQGTLGRFQQSGVDKLRIYGNGTMPVATISATTSFAALVVDNNGLGDIFTASTGGVTKFTVKNNGQLYASNYTNNGGILYTNTNGILAQTAVGNSNECLKSAGGGSPTWGSCAAGSNGTWDVNTTLGIHYPGNNTLDLLIGGTSTQSAMFSVLGIAAGTNPSASVSATQGANAGKGIYMSGDGSLQSVRNNTLTIGGNTTGDIYLRPLNSTGMVRLIHGATGVGGLILGDSENDSVSKTARIKSYGFNTAVPITMMLANNNTANNSSLNIGGSSGSEYAVSSVNFFTAKTTSTFIGTQRMRIDPDGYVSVGNSSPRATLDVRNALTESSEGGTLPIASFSGTTSFAGLVIDNSLGDLITASSSGLTRFVIAQNGNVGIGTSSAATMPSEKLTVVGGNILQTAYGNPTRKGSYTVPTAAANSIFTQGKYAYIADGASGLLIIDIADPANPKPVGNVAMTAANAVTVAGKYAYVTDSTITVGLKIIDISNPLAPSVVSTVPVSGNASTGIFAVGKYIYFLDSTDGLTVVDVSDPVNPVKVFRDLNITQAPQALFISGKYAYVGDFNNSVYIFDISNPAFPVLVKNFTVSASVRGVYVSGSYMYLAENTVGLRIVNIKDPANPSTVGTIDTPANASALFVVGKYAYVADGTSGVQVFNLTNPAAPTWAGSYDTPSNAVDISINGKYAYVADTTSLQVLDIAGIDAPSGVIGSLKVDALSVADRVDIGNDLFVNGGLTLNQGGLMSNGAFSFSTASGSGNLIQGAPTGKALLILNQTGSQDIFTASSSGTTRFSIANSGNVLIGTGSATAKLTLNGGNFLQKADGNPVLKGTYDTLGNAFAVEVAGKYAYVADYASGLQVIDISNPASPTLTGTYDTTGNAQGISVRGNYAYIAGDTAGLQVIDISNPKVPYQVGSYAASGTTWDVYVRGNFAYLANDAAGLTIVDITVPSAPKLAVVYNTAGAARSVYVLGKYAYVADGSSGLQVIDVSNPYNPTPVGNYDTPGSAIGVYVSGKYAYVADGSSSGLRIIDVSNPSAPTQVGYYVTPGLAWGIKVEGKYAYVGDNNSGLQVLDVSDPTAPLWIGNYPSVSNTRGVFVQGKYAYSADNASGLQIIDINGIDAPSAMIGSILASNISVSESVDIGNELFVNGALTLNQGIMSNGSFSFVTASGSGNLVQGATTGKALLTLNQTGSQDIFTASSSGTTRFTIAQSGDVTIGSTTDGLVFSPTAGPTYYGSARPTKNIHLAAEYAGAVLTASGSASTNGSMTSDASPSATFRNYYEWSTNQSGLQDYTVAVNVKLPADFSGWTTNNAITVDFNTATTNSSQNKFDFILLNQNDAKPTTPVVMRTANVSSVAKTWQSLSIPASALTGGAATFNTAGNEAVIYIRMYASSPGYIQVGDIDLNYLSKF